MNLLLFLLESPIPTLIPTAALTPIHSIPVASDDLVRNIALSLTLTLTLPLPLTPTRRRGQDLRGEGRHHPDGHFGFIRVRARTIGLGLG